MTSGMSVDHVLASIDFLLETTSSIPAGFLGQCHVAKAAIGLAGNLVVGGAALDIACDEEADK